MKYIRWSVVCILLLGLAAGIFYICLKDTNTFIMKLGSIEITDGQFQFYLDKNRTDIISSYQKPGETVDDEFWNRQVKDGMSAATLLKAQAKQDCLREQMIFILAKEKGLRKTVTFEEIKEEMEKENSDRENSVKSGKIVYGNKNYSMLTYMNYCISNISRELIKLMEEDELKYTDEQIRSYCEENGKDISGLDNNEIRDKYGVVFKNDLLIRYADARIEELGVAVNQEKFDEFAVK